MKLGGQLGSDCFHLRDECLGNQQEAGERKGGSKWDHSNRQGVRGRSLLWN